MKFHFSKKPSAPAPQPTEAQRASRRRALGAGAYASALGAIVLVVVILVNLVVQAIPTKYTEFDISNTGLFTLSETTVSMLKSLDKDVTAYYLGETGGEDANLTRLLDRYAGESSHFRWEQRDPALYPTFAAQYDAQDASNGSVILVCGENHAVVDSADLYEYDYSSYYTTGSVDMRFNAENALTTAVAQVTRDTSYTAYQLTGHGEAELGSDFTEVLTNAGVTLESLSLTTSAVPEDAAALILNAPQADLSEQDVDALRSYLDGGGRLLVTTSLLADTPNLDALLAEYGMTRQEGLLVETDANHFAYGYGGTYLLPELQSNDITSGVVDGMYVFAPVAQGILTGEAVDTATGETATDETAGDSITHTTLLSTSSSAFSMLDYETATTIQQGENDPTGSFDVAVAAENSYTGARVVWINCANLLLDNINSAVSGGNAQFLGSVMNWMNGEENAAVIESKSMSADSLDVPAALIMPLGLIIVILLPLASLLVGVVISVVRRRR